MRHEETGVVPIVAAQSKSGQAESPAPQDLMIAGVELDDQRLRIGLGGDR